MSELSTMKEFDCDGTPDQRNYSASFKGPAVPNGVSSTEHIISILYCAYRYMTNHSIFSLLKPNANITFLTPTCISY